MKNKKKILLIYFLTLGGTVFWLGLIILAPYLKSKSLNLNVFVNSVFSPICHQIPSRSFFLFGYPLAVCSRCFGIYVGFLIGVLLYPFLNEFSADSMPSTRIFILTSIPIVLDTGGNFFHLWMTPNIPRFIIGLIWGLILPIYFITGIADFFLNLSQTKKTSA